MGAAGACGWLVTAKVKNPRFVIGNLRNDSITSPLPSPEVKKEHYDVLPWEVPQGDDTIKVMGGYSHPPLGQLAPGKIQSHWAHLIHCEKARNTKDGDSKALSAAAEVVKAELVDYFSACREAVIVEMQKARGFVNWLVDKVNEKGINTRVTKVNSTVPSEPDASALLGNIVNGEIISLDELSCYNDRIEAEKRNYVTKMRGFQTRAKGRYNSVFNTYHKLVEAGGVPRKEWELIQGEAKLEGGRLAPSPYQQKRSGITPGSGSRKGSARRSDGSQLYVDVSPDSGSRGGDPGQDISRRLFGDKVPGK